MMSRTNLFLALALCFSVSACDEAVEAGGDFGADDGVTLRPGFGGNGLKLNTSALGDHPLHELNRKGEIHEDVELTGVYLRRIIKYQVSWLELDEVWVDQGELFGRIQDVVYSGAELHGSRWDVTTHGGGLEKRKMFLHSSRYDKVDGVHKYTFGYPNDPTYGMHFYTKKYQGIDGSPLLAACDKDDDGNLEAVLYEDLHVDMKSGYVKEMESLINIACVSGGVGKAATWKYKSYDIGFEEFMAAVRMIRADYCGDGDSWTKPGTAIDLQDVWGYNKFFKPTYETEALWSAKGASCVNLPRRPDFALDDIVCGGVAMEKCGDDGLGEVPSALLWTLTPG